MDREFFGSEDGKRLVKWGTWALIALTVFLGMRAIIAFKEWRMPSYTGSTISVTGEGKANLVPDIATFSFTVSADGLTASEAQSLVTPKMNAILAALKELGVEDKDINTSDYSLWPKYRYENIACSPSYCPPSKQVEDGFTANHNVTVKIRNRDIANLAIGAAGDKGATNISNLVFTVDDPSKLLMEARKVAIEDAKAQAKELAKSLDVKLVRITGFYEESGGYPRPYAAYGGKSVEMTTMDSAPNIPIGEQETDVRVTVTFEIR